MIARALDDRTPRYRLALCGQVDPYFYAGVDCNGAVGVVDGVGLLLGRAVGYPTYDEAEVDRDDLNRRFAPYRFEIDPIPGTGRWS